MLNIRKLEDFDLCRRIWENARPVENIFDLWPVRTCFAAAFDREPFFIVAEENGHTVGLLPLSRMDDPESFGFFPGELWAGKTWLEQNRITAADTGVARALLDRVPGSVHLRYMSHAALVSEIQPLELDEVGYLFFPGRYQYRFDAYLQEFKGKSRKKIGREMAAVTAPGIAYRYNDLSDVDPFFRMNLEAFGSRSYFSDPRFLKSFEKMMAWLYAQGMLRITTILIGGRIAAVDVGAVLDVPRKGSNYTVLAGGTNPEFPGIAKLINFHHLEWACRMRLDSVDFLCGDFGWKERFHLTPRPLYQLRISVQQEAKQLQICPRMRFPSRITTPADMHRRPQAIGSRTRSAESVC
ncbi:MULTISPECIES: GNAT family N-acetyltransferase [Desulfococcus]|jgi:hypothetical protein|uniref:BioF2-like acetyltransferase domain-containing protein n=1 Tax=Desulfococcus multivorans DSM 2059 TaxID=1121405 RepID=S7TPI1_DESML|nr:GNAT family N-acetyltransferase [Desulfococcus multivorans]AOY57738.1 conserved uncharacterized protein related to acyl-CoA acyltranserase [Desulfococcus multivorans]AQV00128.1 cellulose biosynthesis protein CelD [Desulfococcus multivorans]EPR38821.1 hypothetical protein dsmv_0231 [Desulfococcus multivorans DSM 2059]MDX9817978.1 GNAT family N-acetyltransferase [Desulfococcus multivorans]SJZ80229.1 Acetyltransferase (GNAT) domain-containing protein [Desulfococcus multivorans DSM 2059]